MAEPIIPRTSHSSPGLPIRSHRLAGTDNTRTSVQKSLPRRRQAASELELRGEKKHRPPFIRRPALLSGELEILGETDNRPKARAGLVEAGDQAEIEAEALADFVISAELNLQGRIRWNH